MRSAQSMLGAIGALAIVDQLRRSRARRGRRAQAQEVRAAAERGAILEASAPKRPFVAIVMAALNEAESITGVLADLPEQLAGMPVQAIVVDDGSTDDTAHLARVGGAVVASHARNLGQGDGLRTGFAVARKLGALVAVTMDADGQHDPKDLPALVEPVVDGSVDYVQGSRFLGLYDDAGSARHAGIKGFTKLINMLAGTQITDCTNGFRAISTQGLERMVLVEDRFSASEIIIEASARGLHMREVPVHIRRRDAGESRKPRGLAYPLGYLGAIVRSWARSRLPRSAT